MNKKVRTASRNRSARNVMHSTLKTMQRINKISGAAGPIFKINTLRRWLHN